MGDVPKASESLSGPAAPISNDEALVLSGLIQYAVQGEVDPCTAERWRRGFRGTIEEPQSWTPPEVERRLIDGIRLIERTTGRVGPKRARSSSPPYLHDDMDRWYQRMQEEQEREQNAAERNRVRFGATAVQVANAEEALRWPLTYLADHPDERETLKIFLWAKARRRPWQKEVQFRGISRETAKRRKTRAILFICAGLIRGGVSLGAHR